METVLGSEDDDGDGRNRKKSPLTSSSSPLARLFASSRRHQLKQILLDTRQQAFIPEITEMSYLTYDTRYVAYRG